MPPAPPQPAPRAREGTRGTTLSPARPAHTPNASSSAKPLPGRHPAYGLLPGPGTPCLPGPASRASRRVDMAGSLCHYATSPASRPGCPVTAVVRRGTVPLCASCDALRSTLGKGQPRTPIPAPAPAGVLDWIGQAHARVLDTEAELTAAGTRARQHGHSWAAIA